VLTEPGAAGVGGIQVNGTGWRDIELCPRTETLMITIIVASDTFEYFDRSHIVGNI
jgi:hypothetical protein